MKMKVNRSILFGVILLSMVIFCLCTFTISNSYIQDQKNSESNVSLHSDVLHTVIDHSEKPVYYTAFSILINYLSLNK